jgi:hypothetical protein
MDRFREIDDPADARHYTPPKENKINHFVHDSLGDPGTCTDRNHNHPPKAEQNPFDYEDRVMEAMKHAARWIDKTKADHGAVADLRESVTLMHTELTRLRNKPQLLTEIPSARRPGLSYADPMGRFLCWPADTNFVNDFSPLELRVMEAHIRAALDNVSKALHQKGIGA